MSEESNEDFEQVGIIKLIRNMLSPRTIPHIIMIAIVSAILLAMVESNETVVAMAFISMSISYIFIALLSNSSVIQKITKLPETKKDANLITRFLLSFRITIVPILLAAVLLDYYGPRLVETLTNGFLLF